MGSTRRSFSREFKLEAVRMVTEGGHSLAQVARDLGLAEGPIRILAFAYSRSEHNLEALELGVAQIGALGRSRLGVGLVEGLGLGPGDEVRLAPPGGV